MPEVSKVTEAPKVQPVKLVILCPFGEQIDVLGVKEQIDEVGGSACIFNLTGKKIPSQERLGVPVIDQPQHSPITEDKKSCFVANYDPALCLSIMTLIAEKILAARSLKITKGTKVVFHSIQTKGNETIRVTFAKHLV